MDVRKLPELIGGIRRRVTNPFSKNRLLGMYLEFLKMNRSLFAFAIFVCLVGAWNSDLDWQSPVMVDSRNQIADPSECLLFGDSIGGMGDSECGFNVLANQASIFSGRLAHSTVLQANYPRKATQRFLFVKACNQYLRMKLPSRSIIWQRDFFMLPHLTPTVQCC